MDQISENIFIENKVRSHEDLVSLLVMKFISLKIVGFPRRSIEKSIQQCNPPGNHRFDHFSVSGQRINSIGRRMLSLLELHKARGSVSFAVHANERIDTNPSAHFHRH